MPLKKQFLWLFFIFLLTIPAILPLLHKGFFVSDDGEWMIIRLSAFFKTLHDGQIPVRFIGRLNHEYGYPVSNFLYPGFLYMGSLLHILGFGFVVVIKILFFLGLLSSSIFSYLWLRNFFSSATSVVGSMVYLYFPYHIFDAYVRGSLGEILALGILPLLLYSIEKKYTVLISLLYGLLIISHNTVALLATPLIVIYILLGQKKQLISMVLGLGVSAFFWVPALYEKQYVKFDATRVANWSDYFLRNISLIGWISLLILVLGSMRLLYKKEKNIKLIFFFILSCSSILFATPMAYPLWKFFPLGSYIQFPWRFLSLTMIGISFLASWLLSNMSKRRYIFTASIFLLVIIYDVYPLLASVQYVDRGDAFYSTNDSSTTVHDEYMPKWVSLAATNRPQSVYEIKGEGMVTSASVTDKKMNFTVETANSLIFQVNKIYYPGWIVYVNDLLVKPDYSNPAGLMQVPLNRGNSRVFFSFTETPLRKTSNMVSVGIVVALFAFAGYQKINKKNA